MSQAAVSTLGANTRAFGTRAARAFVGGAGVTSSLRYASVHLSDFVRAYCGEHLPGFFRLFGHCVGMVARGQPDEHGASVSLLLVPFVVLVMAFVKFPWYFYNAAQLMVRFSHARR